MILPVFTHPDMLGHAPGAGHPERPQRLATVLEALRDSDLDLAWTEAPLADPRGAGTRPSGRPGGSHPVGRPG